MTPEERTELIDRLDKYFSTISIWTKLSTKHTTDSLVLNIIRNDKSQTFREVIETVSDEILISLKNDFLSPCRNKHVT